jgi:hypothetical protein
MRKYNYVQIFDKDGNSAIVQSYIEDAKEYVENIFTDGTPEMEAYAYELGFREWLDEKNLDCDGNCDECELNDETENGDFEELGILDGFTYSESDEKSHCAYSFYSSDKELIKEAMNYIVKK